MKCIPSVLHTFDPASKVRGSGELPQFVWSLPLQNFAIMPIRETAKTSISTGHRHLSRGWEGW